MAYGDDSDRRGGRGGFGGRGGRGDFGGRGGRGGRGDRDGGFRGGDRDGGFRGGDREGGFRGGDRDGGRDGGFRGRGRGGDFGGRGGGRGRGGDFGGRGGGRGGDRGGRGGFGGGARGGSRVNIEPHPRYAGVFVARNRDMDTLLTRSLAPGDSIYGEKRFPVETREGEKIEYREWNPSRSKLGALIMNKLPEIYIKPGAKVLYLGAASGTTVSHVADIVGPEGAVYAVEFSHRSGRELEQMARKRTNIIPIINDARMPQNYRMLVPGLVDCIFSDVAQPDQSRIVGMNAAMFLKEGGGYVISIKAACVDSTLPCEQVFANESAVLESQNMSVIHHVRLEPFEIDHIGFAGIYKP